VAIRDHKALPDSLVHRERKGPPGSKARRDPKGLEVLRESKGAAWHDDSVFHAAGFGQNDWRRRHENSLRFVPHAISNPSHERVRVASGAECT
jgi:hypothetical protein